MKKRPVMKAMKKPVAMRRTAMKAANAMKKQVGMKAMKAMKKLPAMKRTVSKAMKKSAMKIVKAMKRKSVGRSRKGQIPEGLRAKALQEWPFCSRAEALGAAPGRIEVVGNHTDYNEGYILSAAIDRYVVLAGCKLPPSTTQSRVSSSTFGGPVFFSCVERTFEKKTGNESWANYVIGVVSELHKKGIDVPPFSAHCVSDVPAGSGVSSSAALEMATLGLLRALFPKTVGKLSDVEGILVCKAAENNFVGMGCGVLDQFSSGMGRRDKLISLDCRDLSYSYVPLEGAEFVLANTKAPHQLVDGKYNDLRAACFESADALTKLMGRGTHLRDVDVASFEKHKGSLTEAQMKRAKHIVYENARVQSGVAGLKAGNLSELGRSMTESHLSSQHDFGNSCPELDTMAACGRSLDLCLGCRLMGGGFGGCTINLVRAGSGVEFGDALKKMYKEKTGIDATMIICKTADGACFQVLK